MRFYFEPPAPRKAKSTIRRLLVRCPATAKLAPVGETIDEALWDRTPKKSGSFTCPHCNRVHAWAKKDVLLAR
jgi:hypothetical protein